jgi:uncharacterized membrane protein YphA (DoxX/SURF4 family)
MVNLMQIWRWSFLLLFAAAMLGLGMVKFLSEYQAAYALPRYAYYGSASIEVLAGLMILFGRVRAGAFIALVFFVIAIVFTFSAAGDCGCFAGAVRETRQVRVLLAATGGIWACLILKSKHPAYPFPAAAE